MTVLRAAAIAAASLAARWTAQGAEQSVPERVPHVVTADIQAGIEQHIEDQTRLGGGYFTLAFEDKQLRLKLVRVHTEYLANLGPRRHFACVDLASTEGDVFDVDFFLAGDREGDKYSSLATYYFGHHPANRVELSRGRDLLVEPGPVSGPINYLAYPVLEVAGVRVPVRPQFSFTRIAR